MAQVYVTSDGERFMTTSIRLPVELKENLDILARLTSTDVSSIVIALVEALTEANREALDEFRKIAAIPIVFPRFVRTDEEAGKDECEDESDDGDDECEGETVK